MNDVGIGTIIFQRFFGGGNRARAQIWLSTQSILSRPPSTPNSSPPYQKKAALIFYRSLDKIFPTLPSLHSSKWGRTEYNTQIIPACSDLHFRAQTCSPQHKNVAGRGLKLKLDTTFILEVS